MSGLSNHFMVVRLSVQKDPYRPVYFYLSVCNVDIDHGREGPSIATSERIITTLYMMAVIECETINLVNTISETSCFQD